MYSKTADDLLREIAALGGQEELTEDFWSELDPRRTPDIPRMEWPLTAIRDRLKRDREGHR